MTTPTNQVGTRLMFENEQVRVWDLALAPGESLPTHLHLDPYLFIVVQGGHLRHADPDNPGDAHDVRYVDDQVVFLPAEPGGLLHHRLTNTGDTPYRNFVIELKQRGAATLDNSAVGG